MNDAHEIVRQVYAAKEDTRAADAFIAAYLPFIKAETAKFLKRPPVEGRDDALSIAMIAFHEAIVGYSRTRGAFLRYAALLIRSRLIDYHRKEQRHSKLISLDTADGESSEPLANTLPEETNPAEERMVRDATRAEIQELSQQMQAFGVCLTDVADNCPKQQRTLTACQNVLRYARENPALLDTFLQTKRLPIAQLCAHSGVERKTLERHRKYIIALFLIYSNGYEIIRGHLQQVMKGVAVK